MDYEENDSQGKDLQLAGEGRTKFPPVLRPYALPKFDFDDSLPGHLRFDNLVETEVFLGIESQEGNHWIEDFSRGNPGIEFSSTAAESVSISRCNNVWSEATSSESVEMLLKSVGQEEMIPGQATVEELDACDVLGNSVKQVNASSEQDPALQPDELLEDFPGLNEDAPKIGDSTQSQGGEACLDPNVSCVKQDTLLTEGGNIMDREENKTAGTNFSEPNQTEIDTSSDEVIKSRTKDDTLSSMMGVDNRQNTAVQNLGSCIETLSQENIPQENDTSNINACNVEKETVDGKEEQQVPDNKEQLEDQSRGGDAVESCINDFEKITSVSERNCIELDAVGTSVSGEKSDSSVAEECFYGDPVSCAGSNTEVCASLEDKESGNFSKGGAEDNPPIALRDNSFQESSEAGNNVSDNAANIELKIDSVANSAELQDITKKDELSQTVEQVENVKPEGTLLLAQDDKVCGESHEIIVADISSAKVASCSVELPSGTHTSEDLHGVPEATRASSGEVLTDGVAVSSSLETTTVSKQSNVSDGQADGLLIETQNLDLAVHSRDMGKTDGSTISHKVESSVSKERSEMVGYDSHVGISAVEDAVGTPLPPGDGLPRHDISELKDDGDQTVGDCSAAEKSRCIVSDLDENAPGTVEQQSQAADQVMEICNSATQCTTQGAMEKFNQKISRDSEASLVLSDATVREENIHEHIAAGNHQEGAVLGNALEAPLTLAENIANIDTASEYDVHSRALESGIRSMDSDDISKDREENQDKKQLTDAIVPPLDVNVRDTHKMSTGSQNPKVTGISETKRKTTLEDSTLLDTNKVAESSSVSGSSQKESRLAQKIVQGSAQVLDTEIVQSGSKSTSEHKTRRPSSRSTGKETAKKGRHGKETPTKPLERVDKSSNILPPVGSSLPDLNSSSSVTVMFQQPFTDLQQLQLRAQIFVYGSLIQGTAPDEACMISAFGGTDGGRSIWGNAWRDSLEKLRAQRSQSSTPKTPLQQRSVSDHGNKQAGAQSKVVASPLGRTSKGNPSPVSNPIIPLSSPLWAMNTPSHTAQQSGGMPRGLSMDHNVLPPLHPHQTPPKNNFIGRSAPWTSVPTFPISWGSSPQPVFDTSARFSAKPIMEPVKLTPVRESSMPQSSGINHVTPGSIIHTMAPTGSYAANSPAIDVKNTVSTPGQASTDLKSRKRKKVSAPADFTRSPLLPEARTQPVSSPYISNVLSSSVVVTTPALISKADTGKSITFVPTAASTDYMKVGVVNVDKRVTLSEDTIGKVREAKLQAEDAASLAAAAVDYSQSIWNQLNQQRVSGLLPDVEAKLASAAAAVAAAASVAKAAAAAAKVASDAALQAKLMAEEALASNDMSNPVLSNVLPVSDGLSTLGNATPASILKGEDRTNSSGSFIVAAREAARRKIEAASAASKRAENLDAIVKAAELVAQAVTQAGKVVAMGDPLPLGELVEAGPEGYWKLPLVSSDQVLKSNSLTEKSILNTLPDGPDTSSKLYKGGTSDQQSQVTAHGKLPTPRETPMESADDHTRLIDLISGSSARGEKNASGHIGHKSSGLTETSIKAGSFVEVLRRDDASQAAWFSAHVLELNGAKAYVSYAEIPSSEGSGQLKEWITLGGADNKEPVVRLPHPMTTVQFEGTRKRRRAAMSNYTWSVGDRVDAWMHDCWREGVISEKNAKDDNSLTVHFPAQGKTSVVKAWHLRPSLTWKDGQWVEWPSSIGNDFSAHEGDTPREKRLKLGSPQLEVKGKTVASKSIDDVKTGMPEGGLPEIEGTFNVGKSTRDDNKTDSRRVMRTGLQKEGSKVVFGIPKPGKKRKFMDVSKHYVTEGSSKPNGAVDSVKDKSAKGQVPQGLGLRGWKNSTKVDFRDKPDTEPKSRVPKSGKPPSVSTRSIPQKDKHDTVGVDRRANSKGSGEGATDGTFVFSSSAPSDNPVSSKSSNLNSRASKGKLEPSGKLSKIEEEKVYNGNSGRSGEAVEPRRSNRRIQPTSRLLEGIQSSLSISKIPSVSHDKGHKNQNKGTSRGN